MSKEGGYPEMIAYAARTGDRTAKGAMHSRVVRGLAPKNKGLQRSTKLVMIWPSQKWDVGTENARPPELGASMK
tara:strand:- start:32 stop:253 length:222 start_codon:yes stop_codon:yes gene_type:complete